MRLSPLLPPLVAILAGCADTRTATGSDTRPVVAVSLHPIASLVRAIGGDAVVVRTLLPPGAHPDTYETTPRMAESLTGADLVVRVGGGADAWLGEDRPGTLVLTRGMRLLQQADHDPDHATGNPHVWLDPVLVRDSLLPRLADALTEVAPDSAHAIRERTRAFADSLTALDAEIRTLLRDVPSRGFIAAHPAWDYFAARYDLEQVGVVQRSPGAELGTRELARLVDAARTRGVVAVIAEPQLGRAGVEALADELDVRVEVADPVGGAGLAGREDYLSLMRYDARAFARALGGGGP